MITFSILGVSKSTVLWLVAAGLAQLGLELAELGWLTRTPPSSSSLSKWPSLDNSSTLSVSTSGTVHTGENDRRRFKDICVHTDPLKTTENAVVHIPGL